MSISTVSSNNSHQARHIQQSAPPPVRAEKEKDQVRDNGASSGINSSAPTVNTSGQRIGTTISVTA